MSDFLPFRMVIEGGRMVAASQHDEERLDSYRRGTRVSVSIVEDNQSPLIRKWWAIIGAALKHCDLPWKNKAAAHRHLKVVCGVCDRFYIGEREVIEVGSLSDLDHGELSDVVEMMMGILQRMTGVDPETLGKNAPDTGRDEREIPPQDELPGPDPDLDRQDDDEAGDLPAPETDKPTVAPILVRYARDVLNMAAKPAATAETMKKVEGVWGYELKDLSDGEKELARHIASSMRTILKTPNRLGNLLDATATAIGCPRSALEGI